MYSEIFLLEIKNPKSKHIEKYIIDYAGNKDEEEIKTEIVKYIKEHKEFCGHDFSRHFDGEINVIYFLNLTRLELTIDKNIWDIDNLYKEVKL